MKKLLFIALPLSLMALTLNEMVQKTLDNNPKMQKEISSYRAVHYDLDMAQSGYKPTVDLKGDLGLEYNKRDFSGASNGLNGDATTLVRSTAGIVATENLFEGFATQENINEKGARIASAKFEALQTANTLALRASEVYIEVLRQKEILDLLEENVNSHKHMYEFIRERTEAGSGRRSDVEQAQGRLSLAYSNYVAQVKNYQDAVVNFERVFGEVYTASSLEKPSAQALPGTSYEDMWALAQLNNPTLALEQSNVRVQEARLKKDKGNFYPTIDFELSADMSNNVQGYEGTNTGARGLVKLYYNLYRGGNDESKRLQNLEYVLVQKESLNEQQRAVREKLKLAWFAQEITYHQIRCLKQHVKYTKLTVDSYTKEYQLGRRTIVDLLNAELEYNDARKQLVNAQNDVLYSRLQVLDAIGLLPFALKTDITERLDVVTPEDLNMTVNEPNALEIYGEGENNISIDNICSDTIQPLKIKQVVIPKPKPKKPKKKAVAVSSKTIAIDEVVQYMKEDSKPVIMESLTFKPRSNELSQGGLNYLKKIAKDIEKEGNYIVEISGHTDSIGSKAYNQKLSERRANAARDALIKDGVSPDVIVAIGEGEARPIASNMEKAGRAKNRRIEMKLVRKELYKRNDKK